MQILQILICRNLIVLYKDNFLLIIFPGSVPFIAWFAKQISLLVPGCCYKSANLYKMVNIQYAGNLTYFTTNRP